MSVQLENGYTKIANELYEAWARIRIPGEARQVLDVIIRKTYGFNKKEDKISYSQFGLYTGLDHGNVGRGIRKLLKLNLIVKNDTTIPTSYSINKNFGTWSRVSKKTQGSVNNDLKPVSKKTHTKESNKINNTDSLKSSSEKPMRMSDTRKFSTDYEETITLDGEKVPDKADVERNQLKADVDRVIQEYTTQFIDRVDSADRIPKMAVPALRKIIKNTLKIYSADEIIENIPTYFRSQFYKNSGWALWTLCSPKVINQLKNDPNR